MSRVLADSDGEAQEENILKILSFFEKKTELCNVRVKEFGWSDAEFTAYLKRKLVE